MRPNTVTTTINALPAQGLISRAIADADRRAVKLTATKAGQQAVHAWQATNAAVLHPALSTLPAHQRRALAAAAPALTALASAVDRLADSRPNHLPGRARHDLPPSPRSFPSRPAPSTPAHRLTQTSRSGAALPDVPESELQRHWAGLCRLSGKVPVTHREVM